VPDDAPYSAESHMLVALSPPQIRGER
jgi:hypothetical protein